MLVEDSASCCYCADESELARKSRPLLHFLLSVWSLSCHRCVKFLRSISLAYFTFIFHSPLAPNPKVLLWECNAHHQPRGFKNCFMLSVRMSSYGCTREVWRAREKRASSNSSFLSALQTSQVHP